MIFIKMTKRRIRKMIQYEGNFIHCSEKEAALNILGSLPLEWMLLEFILVRKSPLSKLSYE